MQKLSLSPATGQPGPSTTLPTNCPDCGLPFQPWAKYPFHFEKGIFEKACPDCTKKKEEIAKEQRHLELIEHQKQALILAVEQVRERWSKQCGLEGRWAGADFASFKRDLCPKAFDALKNFDPAKSKSLLLRSDNYGVGKTHLVAALINHLLESETPASFRRDSYAIRTHQCPAYFTTEIKLLSRIRWTFNPLEEGETEEDIYTRLRNAPLLVLDDVGKTKPKDYSFLQGVYFRMIDERYTDETPMILTTNLTLPELEGHIGGASADRLREMCGKDGFITITGKSYRR